MAKKNALGRGLGALISDADTSATRAPREIKPNSNISEIELSKIAANPNQPRTKFDEEAIGELAESIKHLGIIQPITLRKMPDDTFQIISGERRFRAAKVAGLTAIPAYVREVEDQSVLAMALVENVQREDLDAIEIAISYQRLIDECSLTQEQLSEKVGKKRSTVTNYLRLLKLPPEIQLGIINNDISMGHARALITLEQGDDMVKLFTEIIENDLSVRKTEERVREVKNGTPEPEKKDDKSAVPDQYKELKEQIANKFKSSVKFKINDKGKGEIVIPFTSPEELERIVGILDKINN